eukprot:g46476.t1
MSAPPPPPLPPPPPPPQAPLPSAATPNTGEKKKCFGGPHKNRSPADEALIAATEHIATQLHRKIHGNDDNIIYLAEQRRGA